MFPFKRLVSSFGLVAAIGLQANAGTVTKTGLDDVGEGSDGTALSATADWSVSGDTLTLTLTNSSTLDVLKQRHILTAVFFDIAGNPTLIPETAVLNTGSVVLFDDAPDGGVVGGEWAYGSGLAAGVPGGANHGISSAGFGLFGDFNFDGSDLDPPDAVNGINYGLTSAGDDTTTSQGGTIGQVNGAFPLIKNSVVFTLSGASGLDDATVGGSFSNFIFQYGTTLEDATIPPPPVVPPVPLPAAAWMGLPVLAGMGIMKRRKAMS